MFPSFHPQTNGQTERVNQVIEEYLRPYHNQEQDDWTDLLQMAEHTYINSESLATSLTLIYANYGKHRESLNPQKTEVMNLALCAYVYWIKGAFENGKKVLQAACNRMTKNTDTRPIPPLVYKIGDPIMLSTNHIKMKRPSRKTDYKFLILFQIDKIISPTAVRLILPKKWKSHPAFNVSEIEPFIAGNRPVLDFTKILREVSDIEADEEYNVEEIKGSITC